MWLSQNRVSFLMIGVIDAVFFRAAAELRPQLLRHKTVWAVMTQR